MEICTLKLKQENFCAQPKEELYPQPSPHTFLEQSWIALRVSPGLPGNIAGHRAAAHVSCERLNKTMYVKVSCKLFSPYSGMCLWLSDKELNKECQLQGSAQATSALVFSV